VSAPREIKLSSVRRLRRNRRNARTHSKKQIRQIADCILRFGWTYPILVDENGGILAGHGRYEAALLLGLREVPTIVVSGLSDPEKRALALADNKIAANAGWDRAVLAAELGELAVLLPACDLNIEITRLRSDRNRHTDGRSRRSRAGSSRRTTGACEAAGQPRRRSVGRWAASLAVRGDPLGYRDRSIPRRSRLSQQGPVIFFSDSLMMVAGIAAIRRLRHDWEPELCRGSRTRRIPHMQTLMLGPDRRVGPVSECRLNALQIGVDVGRRGRALNVCCLRDLGINARRYLSWIFNPPR
jgi:hypothetical protein